MLCMLISSPFLHKLTTHKILAISPKVIKSIILKTVRATRLAMKSNLVENQISHHYILCCLHWLPHRFDAIWEWIKQHFFTNFRHFIFEHLNGHRTGISCPIWVGHAILESSPLGLPFLKRAWWLPLTLTLRNHEKLIFGTFFRSGTFWRSPAAKPMVILVPFLKRRFIGLISSSIPNFSLLALNLGQWWTLDDNGKTYFLADFMGLAHFDGLLLPCQWAFSCHFWIGGATDSYLPPCKISALHHSTW